MLNERQVAYELLKAVHVNDAYANLELPQLLKRNRLDARAAAFATELSYGVLRWQALIDLIIENAAGRAIDKIDSPLRDVLRLGVYQALWMRVPNHASVHSTVEMAANLGLASAKGFCNATMRRVTEKSLPVWQAEMASKAADNIEKLAIEFSHPRWQVSALRDALGVQANELAALLAVDNTPPEVTAVSRSGERGVEKLLAAGGQLGKWSPLAARVKNSFLGMSELNTGEIGIQDEGSQLVALVAASTPISGSDKHWLDLCAGPGGKAALLLALGTDRGSHLTAVELQPSRAQLVQRALSNFGARATVEIGDGTDPKFATGDFDRVLIDAPCTGLGVIRRRPDSRWRRVPSDVNQLARIQLALLRNGLKAVRSGGIVAYATCSPHLVETEFVVEAALQQNNDFELLDARSLGLNIPDLLNKADFDRITEPGPYLRLWPHRHDTDGMFLAVLRRR